ncbi:hypothetical protein Micbo1qcDRAFT_180387 [Microdochium bolleyi]|uniref:Uncharacterized protein n=1 Tax=Microdochium bolleyi TaxID=196109 RepID=A0A136IM36_9PEZI|nr:hypothetical protein Micbo1qcDRAFT_180387 [Microdochium bolleyi]
MEVMDEVKAVRHQPHGKEHGFLMRPLYSSRVCLEASDPSPPAIANLARLEGLHRWRLGYAASRCLASSKRPPYVKKHTALTEVVKRRRHLGRAARSDAGERARGPWMQRALGQGVASHDDWGGRGLLPPAGDARPYPALKWLSIWDTGHDTDKGTQLYCTPYSTRVQEQRDKAVFVMVVQFACSRYSIASTRFE